jgi:PleD family two-component response regulator
MLKRKVLLVDDSMTTLFMEEMILNGRYQVVKASNGEDAIEKARTERPDLILLDVIMPRMDGFAVCRALRAEEGTRTTPIIMVTTRGEEENVERGFEAGCNDYVTKPINGLELLSKVDNQLASAPAPAVEGMASL